MSKSSKLNDLTDAIDRYGNVSVEIYRRVKGLGFAIRDALPEFLGENARVFGVPPDGEWKPDDYRDAMFSYYGGGALSVGPAQLGLAVQIPHKKDDGALWVRVTLKITPRPKALAVHVGDGWKIIETDEPYEAREVTQVCQAIYEYLLAMFRDPVALATAEGRGKLGFIQG
jgi:hypothetical protein